MKRRSFSAMCQKVRTFQPFHMYTLVQISCKYALSGLNADCNHMVFVLYTYVRLRMNQYPCIVFTVGCSNWKRMFLVLEGRLPVPAPDEKRPSEAFLNSASKLANLPPDEREWRLKVSYSGKGRSQQFRSCLNLSALLL